MTWRELPELPARFRKRITLAATAAALALTPATAQQVTPTQPTAYQHAIAAGYKALTLCSAMFNAQAAGSRRTRRSVEAHELKGIYPEYDALLASLPATIGERRVTVAFDPALPPRVADSGVDAGCTIYPIGTSATTPPGGLLFRPSGKPEPWPVGDSRATARGAETLRTPVRRAFDAETYGHGSDTTALVVLQDGRIVAERYAPGFGMATPQRTWSVGKSIAGTLIGAAAARGLLVADEPADIPEWRTPEDPRQAITIDNLLRMASGLHSATAGNRTDAVYFGGTSVDEETVAWPLEAAPGMRFRYANNDILLAVLALRERVRKAPGAGAGLEKAPAFANDLLLDPLSMNRTFAERDWRNNYILSSQVWSTARDLARLGQFWLQDGVWQSKRLLPEGWMRYMTTPSGPQPADGPGYGATMWLFGPKQGLPEGSYAAQGNRGQYVMVIPSKRLVIVRRGEDPGAARFDIARFAADVAKALP